MELNKVSDIPCPAGIIAIAINDEPRAQHCGIIYTDQAGGLVLCDMQWEKTLGVRAAPGKYFWTRVFLTEDEVDLVSVVLDMVIQQHFAGSRLPYSTVYSSNGFDVAGRIRGGVGVTCATFVINVFEQLALKLVDTSTWRSRPKQDNAFRNRIVEQALKGGDVQFAIRIQNERAAFRIKPFEVYGSATHDDYPIRFIQATKLAKTVVKLVRRKARK
jgi:hypothetical protein